MNFEELAGNLGLEVDEYRELIDLFIDSGKADFLKLQQALADSDSDQLMRSAHNIKGAAGNLGLHEVSETAKIIEENANSNQLGNLGPSLSTLKTQFDAIEAFAHG